MTNLALDNLEKNLKKEDTYRSERISIFEDFVKVGLPSSKADRWKYFDLSSKAKKVKNKNIKDSIISISGKKSDEINFYEAQKKDITQDIYFKPKEFIKNEPMLDLNLSCSNQVNILDIKSDQEEIITITIESDGENLYLPRILINIDKGINAKILLKNLSSSGLTNLLVEYSLEKDSNIEIYRFNNSESTLVETNVVYLKENSNFDLLNLSTPKGSSRYQLFSHHLGSFSLSSCNTVSIPYDNSNDDILIDNSLMNSDCENKSGIRAILDSKSICSFQSLINIKDSVIGSKAEQDCKGFLLSDDSVMNAIPQMNIFNDDVICKHGATIGSLDKQEIFYLCTRGINKKEAEKLLLNGHISEYIKENSILRNFLPGDFR